MIPKQNVSKSIFDPLDFQVNYNLAKNCTLEFKINFRSSFIFQPRKSYTFYDKFLK